MENRPFVFFAEHGGLRAFAALVLAAATLFSGGCKPRAQDAPDVILLHTGRLRGNIYPLSLQDIAPLQHYHYIAGYVKSVREEAARTGARVVLVDLGDSLEGSFASYATDSENITDFFGYAGYDAVVLGNLDNQVPDSVLGKIRAKVLSPFLAADGTPAIPSAPAAARISDGNGRFPVYLLANFYGDTPPEQFPDRFPVRFGGRGGIVPSRDIEREIAGLGDIPEDALLLFAWLKFEAPERPPERFLERLRAAGIDAVLAHRVYGKQQIDAWSSAALPGWDPPVSQNILRNNGGFTVARMDMKFDRGKWKVLRQEIVPMTANSAPADQGVIALEQKFAARIQEADLEIGDLEKPWGEADILGFALRCAAKIPGASGVAYSPQSVRSTFPAGKLTASRVFRALPWNGALTKIEVTRAEAAFLAEENPGWSVWVDAAAGRGGGAIGLVTPEFFAEIAARQLGRHLPAETVATSEFAYFLGCLIEAAASGELGEIPGAGTGEAALPAGWEKLGGEER